MAVLISSAVSDVPVSAAQSSSNCLASWGSRGRLATQARTSSLASGVLKEGGIKSAMVCVLVGLVDVVMLVII